MGAGVKSNVGGDHRIAWACLGVCERDGEKGEREVQEPALFEGLRESVQWDTGHQELVGEWNRTQAQGAEKGEVEI